MNGSQAMATAMMPSTIAAVAAELVPGSPPDVRVAPVENGRSAGPTSRPIGSTKRLPSVDTSAVHVVPLK